MTLFGGSNIRRVATLLVVLSVGTLVSTPHLHVASDHGREICSGHLNDAANPDTADHGTTCPHCLAGKHQRFNAPESPVLTALARRSHRIKRVDRADPPRVPILTGRGAPRAPPAQSRI